MQNLFENFWLLAIVVNTINAAIYWQRALPYIRENPNLKVGYIKLIRGFFLGVSSPWIVMGVGLKMGGVPKISAYLHPNSSNNIFIIAWWAWIWLLTLLFYYWIWFRGGAQMLIEHPGLLRGDKHDPQSIKWMSLVLILVCTVTTAIAFTVKPR